jgi:hypothetical protein
VELRMVQEYVLLRNLYFAKNSMLVIYVVNLLSKACREGFVKCDCYFFFIRNSSSFILLPLSFFFF